MSDQKIVLPPASLLDPSTTPEVRTLLAEVRSDASLPFDPAAAPNYLSLNNVAFGALTWGVSTSLGYKPRRFLIWLNATPTGLPPFIPPES